MKSEDWDKLLEQGLSGSFPRPGFEERVLEDSVMAFVHGRRSRAWRRAGSLAAAAVLIAGVSFLLGRHSVPEPVPGASSIVAQTQGVTVPNDLVAWLDAAEFFRQLGMPDRVGRAVDRANRLLPAEAAASTVAGGTAAPGREIGSVTPGEGTTRTPGVTSRAADPRFTVLSALAFGATPLPLRPSPPEPGPSSAENASPIMTPSLGE